MNSVHSELDPLRRLILAYARSEDRDHYSLSFGLDFRLAEIIRSTSELLIGQMRLTWWRDNLTKENVAKPAGEPLIELLQSLENEDDVSSGLVKLVDGWEMLLADFPWDDRQFEQYSSLRGGGAFRSALGGVTELSQDQLRAAQGWALWDFARHCSDENMRTEAFSRSCEIFDKLSQLKFDRNGRPLSILCKLAARDVKKRELSVDLYRPAVAAVIIWHGLTGL
ncbi:hypothetical protein [Parasphingorhabdus sp.]|uniref:hypothetical protein n=1 Tax=Parasphingorhabdus sp. TaxID=2709688 RepID=UPI003266BDAE